MTINEYQTKAHTFALYPYGHIDEGSEADYLYPALGLAEEAGEVAGKYAKAIRDCKGGIDNERKEAIIKELGDVCWFVAELSTLLDVPLQEVMLRNINKLTSRLNRGVINGEGDNR